MKEFFRLEKIPYYLTLLFTIIGLQFNYIVHTLITTPTIEFHYTIIKTQNIKDYFYRQVCCEVTNITNDKSFKNLEFTIAFPSIVKNDSVYNPQITTFSPSSLLGIAQISNQGSVIFKIGHLQPGMKYQLGFEIKSKTNELPKLYIESTETVRVVKKSASTFIVKHNLGSNYIYFGPRLQSLVNRR